MPPSGTGAMIPQVKTGRKAEVADLIGLISGGVPGAKPVLDVGQKLSTDAMNAYMKMIRETPPVGAVNFNPEQVQAAQRVAQEIQKESKNIKQLELANESKNWTLPQNYDDVTQLKIPKNFGGLKTKDYLFHGGVKDQLNPSALTSFSKSPQEALEYTTISGGNMAAIPKSSLKIYKGNDDVLNQAAKSGNLEPLKNAGYDGFDLRSFYPGGYREVMVWNLGKALDKAAYAPVGRVGDEIGITEPLKSASTNKPIINFNEWFEDSKVIDKDGQPLVVYHGTSRNFTNFKTKEGAFFTPKEDWANYHAELSSELRDGKGKINVMPVYLKIKNPLRLDGNNPEVSKDYINNYSSFQKEAKSKGYDGLVIENSEGGTEYIVFKPTQIKSAVSNTGNYDPKNPNIMKGVIPAIPAGGLLDYEER
jgi:hypothetical protein